MLENVGRWALKRIASSTFLYNSWIISESFVLLQPESQGEPVIWRRILNPWLSLFTFTILSEIQMSFPQYFSKSSSPFAFTSGKIYLSTTRKMWL